MMNEKFIHSWAGHLDFLAAELLQAKGKDLPHALEQLPTRLKVLADEMRAEAPNGIKTPADKLRETADLLPSLTDCVGKDAAVFVVAAVQMLDAAISRCAESEYHDQAAQVARAALDLQFIDGLPVPASIRLADAIKTLESVALFLESGNVEAGI